MLVYDVALCLSYVCYVRDGVVYIVLLWVLMCVPWLFRVLVCVGV